jgi:hypothetical protein
MSRVQVQENILTEVQFKFEIYRLPHVTYHLQSTLLPSIQIDQPMQVSSRRDIPLPGSKLNFDPYNIDFIVDDDLKNYNELLKWMVDMATSDTREISTLFSDAVLHILNADGTPKTRFKFFNCYPNMISELPFNSTTQESSPIIATSLFNYSHFLPDGFDEI